MPIDTDILITYGATVNRLKKNTIIFSQGDKARFYFQILEGQVKTYNLNPKQKEFVQGIFNTGDSFGEPSLFIEEPYSVSAITTENSILLRLPKNTFMDILKDHPAIQMSLLISFSKKLLDTSVSSRILNIKSPEQRILEFLEHHKKKSSVSSERILVPFTRQEIANLTGLRIETVIRALRKLNEENKVDITHHKVYY
jgi:CRP-like cAMP-binding protein